MRKAQHDRVAVAGLLHAHLDTLRGVQVTGPGNTALSYRVRIDQHDYYAVCLVNSSDYWYHRLHLTAPGVSLIVCLHHDTVLPIDTLELHTGRHYTRFEQPVWFPTARTSWQTAQVVLGQLLAGDDSAWSRLRHAPKSTRHRYQERVKRYNVRRPGKPLAV